MAGVDIAGQGLARADSMAAAIVAAADLVRRRRATGLATATLRQD